VTVKGVEGQIGATILGTKIVLCTVGDPIIGSLVSLGPDTFLSANSPAPPPPSPQPFEQFGPGLEPMENFECHVGTKFSGKPATLNDRPKANGFFQLSAAELTKYGVVSLNTFASQRKTQLLADYHALTPADRTGTAAGRNLATRIAHLGLCSRRHRSGNVRCRLDGAARKPTTATSTTRSDHWNSIVMAYFKLSSAFRFSATLLNFHSDEQCGQVDGTLQPLTPLLNRQMP
jgi:hypothetical protein